MPEDVLFWKWISTTAIGLVTETAVYHWNLEAGSAEGEAPRRVFDRHSSLAGCQIINYKSDASGKWLLLVGITAQQGRVVGAMQLFNVDRNVSQPIEGHCGVFAEFLMPEALPSQGTTKVFAFAVRNQAAAKLSIVEIDHREGAPVYAKKTLDLFFPPEAANDFPVSMQFSSKYALLYVVTKYGFIHLYDVASGTCIFMNRISSDTIFVTSEYRATGGIMGVNRKGQVLSVSLDESSIIPYLVNTLGNADVALQYAARNGIAGAENLFVERFQQLLGSGQVGEAARLAARSPKGLLRTPTTIEALKACSGPPSSPGEMSPLLQYFGMLLEGADGLNEHEAIELAKPVLTQGKKGLLEKWLKEERLACSVELGDIVRQFDTALALSVFLRADAPDRVCECFAELGQFSKLLLFAKKVGYAPDWLALIRSTLAQDVNRAAELAKALLEDPETSSLDLEATFELFAEAGHVQAATFFALDRLKQDTPDLGPLQTRLLTLNLEVSPQVANALLEARMFSHYDRNVIAGLCEAAGLWQRALEHYGQAGDMIRVLSSVSEPDTDWLATHAQSEAVSPQVLKELLEGLLEMDAPRFAALVTKLAVRTAGKFPPMTAIDMFSSRGEQLQEALYVYLASVAPASDESPVQLAYMQAAVATGHMKELEKFCREASALDPAAAIAWLEGARLEDPLPLIILCDRFDRTHDLVLHLHERGAMRYIEVYVQRVNPSRLPAVLGALLDVGSDEEAIKSLLLSVPAGGYSVADLVQAAEERNRLAVVLPVLESRVKASDAATSQDRDVHNALAKIYVDAGGRTAEEFLLGNRLYNPVLLGRYAEKRDPHLALLAFERGQCDAELMRLTNANGMYKQQARYLLTRKDSTLWSHALASDNPHRGPLVEQAVGTVVPESSDAEQVSAAVKALLAAGLHAELVTLLERLLLQDGAASPFAANASLQNLLLQTAIKAVPERVSDLLGRLKSYDAVQVAKAAIAAGLNEEAFLAYKLAGRNPDAVAVLLDQLRDPVRAAGFAELLNEKETWSRLALGQRQQGLVREAIDSYLRAEDPSDHVALTAAAHEAKRYEDLVRYLTMARGKLRDPAVETELAFALAMTNRLAELETMVARPNLAQVQSVADRCFEAQLYAAARILYSAVANWSRLAVTLVHLGEHGAAVEAAKKAGNLRVWQQVLEACLEHGEYGLAQACGTHLVPHADELERLVAIYEERGLAAEAIALLEASLSVERAHMGIFTELTVLLARHRPERLMDHLTLYWSRINMPRAIAACSEAHLWPALAFLHLHHDDHDRAVGVMLEHPVECWEHERACAALTKAGSPETLYKAIEWYRQEQPLLLCDLLLRLAHRLDPSRVVDTFRKHNLLPLIKPFLVAVQQPNSGLTAVNTALNELLLAEEDAAGLAASFERSDRFDQQAWAARLREHGRQDIRRLAARLYTMHGAWRQAMDLLIQEALFVEATRTAAASRDPAMAELLLRHFVAIADGPLFVGCLYACYDLLRPDLVLELAWSAGWTDLAMPYFCQTLRQQHDKLTKLEAVVESGAFGASAPASAQATVHAKKMASASLAASMPGSPHQR